ncbi:MAG: hypothetical protein QXU75_06455, partial [Candidatus Methanomethylicaceae archaeon]
IGFIQGFSPIPNHLPSFMQDCILESTQSGLYVEALNYESHAKVKLDAIVEKEGQCTVPMKYLLRILKSIDSDDVRFELYSNHIEIAANSSKFKLSTTVNIDSFSRIKEPDMDSWISVISGDLADAVRIASGIVVSEVGRSELDSVLFQIQGEELAIYGTDARRLIKVRLPYGGSGIGGKIVIHSSTCKLLNEICEKVYDEIQLSFDRTMLYLKLQQDNDLKLIVRVRALECEYPDVESVLEQVSKEYSITWHVKKQDLIDVCKKAISIFNTDICSLIFDLTPKGVSCSAEHSGNEYIGNIEGQVDGNIKFALNAKLLLDMIKLFYVNELEFGINAPDKPVLIKEAVSLPSGSCIGLIMPLRQ